MTEKELGKIVHLDSGTLAPLLKRLDKQGLINRIRPDDNERRLYITLTDKGEALKEAAKAVPGEMTGCINLPEEELIALRDLLNKAIFVMDEDTRRRTHNDHQSSQIQKRRIHYIEKGTSLIE